jgi:hypothetical protein
MALIPSVKLIVPVSGVPADEESWPLSSRSWV